MNRSLYAFMAMATAAVAATWASPVPGNVDPAANMSIHASGLHSVRDTMGHAARLVSQGQPEDLALAGKMIDAVIQCQERRPDHAHYGNFRWYRENATIEDLNGVSFTLAAMIPMMIRHGDRLPEDLRQRIFASIRLGLDVTKRLDVSPGYTNIALFDIESTCRWPKPPIQNSTRASRLTTVCRLRWACRLPRGWAGKAIR